MPFVYYPGSLFIAKNFAAISRWLGAIDQGEAHKAASSLGFSGTGEWLLSSEELTLWLNADTAFLWLYGIRKISLKLTSSGL